MRGATPHVEISLSDSKISIHAPRAGRDWRLCLVLGVLYISIHAPRAGRDSVTKVETLVTMVISIHAPRAGRDEPLQGTFL